MKLTYEDRYECMDWPGIAVRYVGPDHGDCTYHEDDDDWYCTGDHQRVRVVMVGDDRVHVVDRDTLRKLDELDYCAVCGQVGCAHDGRDRSQAT